MPSFNYEGHTFYANMPSFNSEGHTFYAKMPSCNCEGHAFYSKMPSCNCEGQWFYLKMPSFNCKGQWFYAKRLPFALPVDLRTASRWTPLVLANGWQQPTPIKDLLLQGDEYVRLTSKKPSRF
jgi:hypothetical protein